MVVVGGGGGGGGGCSQRLLSLNPTTVMVVLLLGLWLLLGCDNSYNKLDRNNPTMMFVENGRSELKQYMCPEFSCRF